MKKGYIFLSNNKTYEECISRMLFGTSNKSYFEKYFQQIEIGDVIFLFNSSNQTLSGPFYALTKCQKNIDSHAWNSHFQYQVRVVTDNYSALSENEFSNIISFHNNTPPAIIYDNTLTRLDSAYQRRLRVSQTNDPESIEASFFILKCDNHTAGAIYQTNIFGAPSAAFRTVNRIKPGDVIFLWNLSERKLFGEWQAIERCRYSPNEFPVSPDKFPVVIKSKPLATYQNGISESDLKQIISFNTQTNHPYYSVSFDKGVQIQQRFALGNKINELPKQNNTTSNNSGISEYLTDDGHRVKSQGEVLIDNWLFMNRIPHAYEFKVYSKLGNCISDFYIPEKNIIIEYWGLISQERYRERRKKKLNIYRQAGFKIVEIFPNDIKLLSEVLAKRLTDNGVKVYHR